MKHESQHVALFVEKESLAAGCSGSVAQAYFLVSHSLSLSRLVPLVDLPLSAHRPMPK